MAEFLKKDDMPYNLELLFIGILFCVLFVLAELFVKNSFSERNFITEKNLCKYNSEIWLSCISIHSFLLFMRVSAILIPLHSHCISFFHILDF